LGDIAGALAFVGAKTVTKFVACVFIVSCQHAVQNEARRRLNASSHAKRQQQINRAMKSNSSHLKDAIWIAILMLVAGCGDDRSGSVNSQMTVKATEKSQQVTLPAELKGDAEKVFAEGKTYFIWLNNRKPIVPKGDDWNILGVMPCSFNYLSKEGKTGSHDAVITDVILKGQMKEFVQDTKFADGRLPDFDCQILHVEGGRKVRVRLVKAGHPISPIVISNDIEITFQL